MDIKRKVRVLDKHLIGKAEDKQRGMLTDKHVYQRTEELLRTHLSF